MIAGPLVEPARAHDPTVLAAEIAFLRPRNCRLVPGMMLVHRIAEGILLHEHLGALPIIVIRMAKQNPDVQVDVHEVRGHELAVHNDARSHVHRAAPARHVLVRVVAYGRIVERAPATEQDAALSNFLIAWKRLIEKVEEVIVKRHDFLHEFHVLHQTNQVIREELDRGNRADSAGIQG